ncbi:MAG: hypothetical protein ACE5JU_15760, partial [Candidatus Binatia bacterium]
YFAHSENSAGIKHDLVEHLTEVARLAAQFAGKFGTPEGWWDKTAMQERNKIRILAHVRQDENGTFIEHALETHLKGLLSVQQGSHWLSVTQSGGADWLVT